jgi:vacuolar-type H+-ATPase subunit E/Vma4
MYFNHKQAESRNAKEYIASLLRQLEQQKETLSTSVENAYETLSNTDAKPDLANLKTLLLDSINSFKSRTCIVLDALDECSEDTRQSVINTFQSLISTNHQVYLFIATRPNSSIDSLLLSFPNETQAIDIFSGQGPQSRDLKIYVDVKLSEKPNIKPEERAFISECVLERAQGLCHPD